MGEANMGLDGPCTPVMRRVTREWAGMRVWPATRATPLTEVRSRRSSQARIVGMAGKTVGAKQDSLSDLYLRAVERKTARILDDAKTSETPVGPTIQSADCQEECVQKIFYPQVLFLF